MSKSVQTTTCRFLAAIAQQIPEMSEEVMLDWTNNKTALGKGLRELLLPSVMSASTAPPKSSTTRTLLKLVESIDLEGM